MAPTNPGNMPNHIVVSMDSRNETTYVTLFNYVDSVYIDYKIPLK